MLSPEAPRPLHPFEIEAHLEGYGSNSTSWLQALADYEDLVEQLPAKDQRSLEPKVLYDPASNAVAAYLLTLSPKSRAVAFSRLKTIARFFGNDERDPHQFFWQNMTCRQTLPLRDHLAAVSSPYVANATLTVLRGVLQAAWKLGQMEEADYLLAIDLPPIEAKTARQHSPVNNDDFRLFAQACLDGTAIGVRDLAIVVLASCAVRREEIVELNIEDYDAEKQTLRVRSKKTGKERVISLLPSQCQRLNEWLIQRQRLNVKSHAAQRKERDKKARLARGTILLTGLPAPNLDEHRVEAEGDQGKSPLFAGMKRGRRGGGITERRLTPPNITQIFNKRCTQAGIKKISPFDLRTQSVQYWLDQGVDTEKVMERAGLAKTSAARRYGSQATVNPAS